MISLNRFYKFSLALLIAAFLAGAVFLYYGNAAEVKAQGNNFKKLKPLPPVPPKRKLKTFKIGYAHADPGNPLNSDWFRTLQKQFNSDPDLLKALNGAGYKNVAVIQADGFKDLIQRMESNEFDCAFSPSVVYVRQQGEYLPAFQLKPKGVHYSSRPDEKVLLRFSIILGPHHPLFNQPKLSDDQLKSLFEKEPIACVSPYSAAGYVSPLNYVYTLYGATPRETYFYNSSESVVKAVVSGLANIGICEYSALENMLKESTVQPKQLHKNLVSPLPLVPADAIVVRKELRYEAAGLIKELGETVKSRMPEGWSVVPGRDEMYSELRRNVEFLDKRGRDY